MADRLRVARVRSGLSQAELAVRVGVGQQAISRYETGERSPDAEMIARIERVLGESVAWGRTERSVAQGA